MSAPMVARRSPSHAAMASSMAASNSEVSCSFGDGSEDMTLFPIERLSLHVLILFS
jgi:hypothetical protein